MSTSMNTGKKGKIIGVAVLAAVLLIGGTYWAGKSTEATFRDAMKEAASSGLKVTVVDYQRGFFSATARTEWAMATSISGDKPKTLLSFNHSIRHGPLLAFASLASIDSKLDLPKEMTEELTAFSDKAFGSDPFGGKPPLTIKSTFGLTGGIHTRIVSPKAEASGQEGQGRLSWGGLDGEITVDSSRSKVKAKIVMDGLSVAKSAQDQPGQDHLQIGRIVLQSDSAKIKGFDLLSTGTSSLDLDKLSFRFTKEHDAVLALTLENARSDADVAYKEDGALDMKIRFGMDSLVLGDKPGIAVAKSGVTLLYENLDARAVETFFKAVQDEHSQNDLDEDENATLEKMVERRREKQEEVEKQTGAFLKRNPAFSIKDLSAGWPEGAMAGNFRIAYIGKGDLSTFSPSDLAVDFQFSLPLALISRLAKEHADDEEENAQELLTVAVNALADKGFLINENGILRVDGNFKDGVLSLNGKPTSPEAIEEALKSLKDEKRDSEQSPRRSRR